MSSELEDRTRAYCGAYGLVRRLSDGKLFRAHAFPKGGYEHVEGAYDAEGYLQREHWSLPRLKDLAQQPDYY